MVGDAAIGIGGWPFPPVHGVDVHLHVLREPRQQLPVADFPATVAVRVNNFTDKRDDGATCHGNSAPYGRQAIQVSIDSAGLSRLTTIRTAPRVQVMATD